MGAITIVIAPHAAEIAVPTVTGLNAESPNYRCFFLQDQASRADTARAWEHHGRPDRAYQALAAAERHAPQEVRRPSVRALVSTLLYAPGPLPPGLRDFAARVGAAA